MWVLDDGERVGRRDKLPAIATGQDNPIWSPGQPVRLFGLPGETVAFQIGVTASAAGLRAVTVDLPAVRGPIELRDAIERFVLHDLTLARRSGGRDRGESLGWQRGAMPDDPVRTPALVPDPLIPVAQAPPFCDYPMTVAPGEHRVVWVELTLPDATPAGRYQGEVRVAASTGALGVIPIEVEIGPVPLPYAAAPALVYYDPAELLGRTGDVAARRRYLQLMHRHHLGTVANIRGAADVAAQRDELTGALFTAQSGYVGPGAGRGLDVVALGTYGSLGEPGPEALRKVEEAVDALRELGLLGRLTIFVYAIDETCDSGRGQRWRALLAQSAVPEVRRVQVGQTCSADPSGQDVDLALVFAGAYDAAQAAAARARGKQVWIYNGVLPRTGSFATDGGFLSLRVNGWIQAMAGIPRWFYWESTFWNDDNRGGHGPYDPLEGAETFHNQHGDHMNGDGVLVYPGQQRGPGASSGGANTWRSVGVPSVLPSLRLAQWRRGISDAGYLQLARARAPQRADAIAAALLPRILAQAHGAPSWPQRGGAFFAARRQLFHLICGTAPPSPL